MNKRWVAENLSKKGYYWGFFYALFNIILFPIAFIIFCVDFYLNGVDSKDFVLLIIYCSVFGLIYSTLGYFIIKRKKWAWAIMLIVDIKVPMIFVFNLFYIKDRWREFSLESGRGIGNPDFLDRMISRKDFRIGAFLSLFWMLGSIVFCLMFDPYDVIYTYRKSMGPVEWTHYFVVLLVPPFFLNFSWIMYQKYVR